MCFFCDKPKPNPLPPPVPGRLLTERQVARGCRLRVQLMGAQHVQRGGGGAARRLGPGGHQQRRAGRRAPGRVQAAAAARSRLPLVLVDLPGDAHVHGVPAARFLRQTETRAGSGQWR